MTNVLEEVELHVPLTHKRMKRIITKSLESEGIDYETEYWVSDSARVDVYFDGIVIEIKSPFGTGVDEAQLEKYESADCVEEVVLAVPEDMAPLVRRKQDRQVLAIPRERFTLE